MTDPHSPHALITGLLACDIYCKDHKQNRVSVNGLSRNVNILQKISNPHRGTLQVGQQFTDIFIRISKHCWAIFFSYITDFLTVKVLCSKKFRGQGFQQAVCLFFFGSVLWFVWCVWAVFCDVCLYPLSFSARALIPRTLLKGEASS